MSDLDERYMSQEMRDKVAEAKQELKDNPITWKSEVASWYRVNVYYPAVVSWLRIKIETVKMGKVIKLFLFGRW